MKIQPIFPSLLFASAVVLCVPQSALAQTINVQVTGIQLEKTPNGLRVIVETAEGKTPQAFIIPSGETVEIQLLDAQLSLADGQNFNVENPIEGIVSVTVTPGEANTVRVTIVGTQGAPSVEIVPTSSGVALDLSPSSTTATPDTEPSEEIEIIATTEANENDYIVEDASTATFTDTPLRDIPQSIQVIPEQVIEDQQVIRLDEALRNVSGVVPGNTFGGTNDEFVIRGFPASTGNLLLDGFRLPNSGTTFRESATLERIEVLKGPASILYGFVEPGGVINLVSKKPLSEPYYASEVQIASFAFVRPTFDLSGPLTEDKRLLYRLNIGYETEDGFRAFDQGVNRFFITPVVSWKPSDRTNLLLDLSFLDDERPFDRGLSNNFNLRIPDVPVNRIYGEPDDSNRVEEFSVGYRFEHQFNDNWELQNNFRYISSFAFNYRAEPLFVDEENNLFRNFRSNDAYEELFNLQTRLIGKVSTGPVDHTLLFGIDFFRETFWQKQNRLPGGLTPSINLFDPQYNVIARPLLSELTARFFFFRNRTDYVGVYLQDQITITDNLKLLLNGRFDVATQEFVSRATGEGTRNGDSEFTPRAGIVYQPIQPVSLYASYSESFVPNGSTSVDGTFLQPEEGRQYEIGIRTELQQGRIVLNLAAYDITKNNVATDDPDNPGFSIPTGEIRSQGIEFDVIGRILPGWNIIASYAYTDARITEDTDPQRVGLRQAYVPYSAASLWTTYTIQSGALEGLGFGLGFFHIGDRTDGDDPGVILSRYTRTDAAIYYRRANWEAAVNFKNLFNEDYIESGFYNPGDPFNVIGSFSIKF